MVELVRKSCYSAKVQLSSLKVASFSVLKLFAPINNSRESYFVLLTSEFMDPKFGCPLLARQSRSQCPAALSLSRGTFHWTTVTRSLGTRLRARLADDTI